MPPRCESFLRHAVAMRFIAFPLPCFSPQCSSFALQSYPSLCRFLSFPRLASPTHRITGLGPCATVRFHAFPFQLTACRGLPVPMRLNSILRPCFAIIINAIPERFLAYPCLCRARLVSSALCLCTSAQHLAFAFQVDTVPFLRYSRRRTAGPSLCHPRFSIPVPINWIHLWAIPSLCFSICASPRQIPSEQFPANPMHSSFIPCHSFPLQRRSAPCRSVSGLSSAVTRQSLPGFRR